MSIFRLGKKVKTATKLFLKPYMKMRKDKEFKQIIKYTKMFNELTINENVILYESFHGEKIADSPLAIFKQMVKNPAYSNYHHVWVMNSSTNPVVESFKEYKNVSFVQAHEDSYLKMLASAKYLINNHSFPTFFQKKEGQVYINTWHNTPWKIEKKEAIGEISPYHNVQRNLLHADYILAANEYTAKVLIDAYGLEGFYNGSLVTEGYPRVDLTLDTKKSDIVKSLTNSVVLDANLKTVLYAPVWKESFTNVQEIITAMKELYAKLPQNYQLLLKVSSSLFKHLQEDEQLKKRCIPDWLDENEVLAFTDVLLSDSVKTTLDFMTTGKPIIFINNKQTIGEIENVFKTEASGLPGPLSENADEIVESLLLLEDMNRTYNASYKLIQQKYGSKNQTNCTEFVIDMVFRSMHKENHYKATNEKKNMLIYCGGFLNNGITSSAINLLNNIDYSKYNVAVVDKTKTNQVPLQNLQKLNPKAKTFFRVGRLNYTIPEYYKHHYVLNKGLQDEKFEKYVPKELYKREMLRLFGDVKFDIVVDFSGYVPFWSMLLAFGDFNYKSIYQHNDMYGEYHKQINNKFKHKTKLNIIFTLYKHFDKVIAVSKDTKDLNLKNLNRFIPAEKATYVHNCIDPQRVLRLAEGEESTDDFHLETVTVNNFQLEKRVPNHNILPSKEKVNLVTMGRLSPEKDQKKLIKAFASIAEKHKDVMLYIIGEGQMEEELKEFTKELTLENRVIFTGQLSNPFFLINRCDCFILPSNHEGQPMVLLETLILNIPIIATDIAGSRSVLKNDYGLLVDNSVDGLITGIEKFLTTGIASKKFDFDRYNKEALEMFYAQSCNSSNALEKVLTS